MVTYTHRLSFLTKERTYRTTDNALIWNDVDSPEIKLNYSDIVRIEGRFNPSRVQSNRYLLRIISRNGINIDISNTSYKGFGDFQENNETYIPFVKALHKKIFEANPKVQFNKGISSIGYIASIVTVFILLVVLIIAGYFFLTHELMPMVFIQSIFIIIYFPSLIRYIKENKLGTYDPIHLPNEIVPEC